MGSNPAWCAISLCFISVFLKLKPIRLSGWPAPAQTSPCRPSDRDEHCPGHHFWLYFGLCQFCAYTVPHPLMECHPSPAARVLAHRASPHTLKAAALHSAEFRRSPLPYKRSSRCRPWKNAAHERVGHNQLVRQDGFRNVGYLVQ